MPKYFVSNYSLKVRTLQAIFAVLRQDFEAPSILLRFLLSITNQNVKITCKVLKLFGANESTETTHVYETRIRVLLGVVAIGRQSQRGLKRFSGRGHEGK